MPKNRLYYENIFAVLIRSNKQDKFKGFNKHKMKILKYSMRFILKKIQFYLLSLLNALIIKNDSLIFISDKNFKKDNVWAIVDYMTSNDKYSRYQIIYYSKLPFSAINNVRQINSKIRSLYYQCRARYVFYSYREMFVFLPMRNQVVLDTMHGSPLKNIGYLASESKFGKYWKYENTYSHILCVSDYFKEYVKLGFGASDEQCLIFGYPRNDYIFSTRNVFSRIGIDKDKFSRIIIWMPTWRGVKGIDRNYESDIDFPILNSKNTKKFDDYLNKNCILVIIKAHPIQANIDYLQLEYNNIKLLKDEDFPDDINFYELFKDTDALITDYSSVSFDYLLTMKPIGYTIEDFESYQEKRGFAVEDPLSIMPGHKINNYDDLIDFFEDLIIKKDDYYFDRLKANNLANKYQDGLSTKRVLDYFEL